MEKRRVSFHTLGCKMNFSESSTLARIFEQGGFERAASCVDADVCVINSCSVTEHADKKCRNLIRRIHRLNPNAIIAVTGCYAQLKPHEIADIEGVDIVLGNNYKGDLYQRVLELAGKGRAKIYSCDTESLTRFFAAFSSGDRTRSFLKVQDGCDYKCAYCTIHYARGSSRNMPIADLVAEARTLAAAGTKEIVVTGINTGDFGRTTGESFVDLIRALDTVEGIERYRISSIEPDLLDPQLIEWVAKESRAFMPHFHIPLQSGSDAVLRLMARRYDTALFADRIAAIKELMPDAFIGVDVIAGARGETEREWEASRRFIEELPVTRLHVFPYSERPGTSALRLSDAVDQATKHRRVEVLTQLSARKLNEFIQGSLGQVRPVLWETERHGVMSGLTDNYLRVEMPGAEALHNTITNVKLVRGDGETVYGESI